MKKFFLTLAAVAIATTAMMAQTNTTGTIEEPDRVQMKALSKNPTGNDIPTGMDRPQVVNTKKHECKDHKDGQPCTKPADQQCDDCKAKAAAAPKHECKKADGQCPKEAAAKKHECKKADGQCPKEAAAMHQKCEKTENQCVKEGAPKHDCKKGEGKCDKAAKKDDCCKDGMKKDCDKAAKKDDCCKDGMKKECNKPADQQCPDCKAKKN